MNCPENHSKYFRLARIAMAVAIIAIGFSRPSAAAPQDKTDSDDLKVEIGKTVEITHSRRYCWFPSIHQFSTGEIMATITMNPDEGNPEGTFSSYCISKDGGQTWGPRQTMGAGASSSSYTEPQPDGTLWELEPGPDMTLKGPTQDIPLTLTKFSKGGREFEQTFDANLHVSLPVHAQRTELFDWRAPDGHVQMQTALGLFGPIIKAQNGDLITPAFYSAERDQRWYRLVLIRSTDGGVDWNEFSTIAAVEPGEKPWAGMGSNGPCEPSLVRLADGRLFVNFRTGDGDIGQTWSSDDGKTWTKPVSIPLVGVALRVRRLSNGILACTTGRPGPVVIMFSMDGTGEKWTHLTPIFSGESTHYTDLIEVAPGKLLVIYDSTPCGWYEIPLADRESRYNTIYGTFITVTKK